MVVFVNDYRSYQKTARSYVGAGVRGFAIRGFGISGFGVDSTDGKTDGVVSIDEMRLDGNGVPQWLKTIGNRVVSAGRKSLPWVKNVAIQLAKDNAAKVANAAASELERANPNSTAAKMAADATRKVGSIVHKQLNKTKGPELSSMQSMVKTGVQDASVGLLKQMLANRKPIQQQTLSDEMTGKGSSQNVFTF